MNLASDEVTVRYRSPVPRRGGALPYRSRFDAPRVPLALADARARSRGDDAMRAGGSMVATGR
jgi:hypothetical protein